MKNRVLVPDDLPVPIFMLDTEACFTGFNAAAQEWLALSRRSLIGQLPDNVFEGASDLTTAVTRAAKEGVSVRMHGYVLRRHDASDRVCDIHVFPVDQGVGLLAYPSDSWRKPAPVGSEAVSAMGRMLAHEIKNPLAGIHGAAQLLREDVTEPDSLGLIDLISDETDRIRRLADRMERLGDPDISDLKPVNIHEILMRARQVMEAGSASDVIFTERYDPSLPPVLGDGDTLMQAILNIIRNAAEAESDDDSPREISLETAFRSGVTRRGPDGKTMRSLPVEIRIVDNGGGIAPAVKDRMFQPFVTDKPAGQGLGLSLVSKIITAHQGLVEVQSRPGRTAFSLLLPAARGVS